MEKEREILLGKSACRGMSFTGGAESEKGVAVFTMEGTWTSALEQLTALVENEEVAEMIHAMLQKDLMEELKEIMGGLNVLIDEANPEKRQLGNLELSIACYLTEENAVMLSLSGNLEEVAEQLDESDRERFLIQKNGLFRMYEQYYSMDFRSWWGNYLKKLLTDPEACSDYVQMQNLDWETGYEKI